MKVFISRKIPVLAKNLLTKEGIIVNVFPHDRIITCDELVKYAKNVDGIISTLSEKYDKDIIDQLRNCKIIANYAVGFNNIDLQYAKSKNIIVTNTPNVLTDATAEIATSLILSCARRIPESERFMRDDKFLGWEPELLLGMQLTGKTVGIIGAGRIGRATAKRLKAFECKIVYFNKSRKLDFEKEIGAIKLSLEKLLKISDIISIHLPLNSETTGLINKERLDLLKPTAIVVNTARGEIIDENYLIKLLKKNKIYSAGFDVYLNEPNFNRELLILPNVVLLPHIGSATVETRNKMAELVAKNIINVLQGKQALTPVT